MLRLKPRPYDMIGDFVTAVTEIKVWDVVLDDNDETEITVQDENTITVVSSVEGTSGIWTVTLSDEDSTVLLLLEKTGAVGLTSSTEAEAGDDRRWDCTLTDGHLASPNGNRTEPVVGSFVYFLSGSPVNFVPNAPTWLTMTAAEFSKWM